MKVVVSGPLCKDRNVISGKKYEKPGGVTYYTGIALARLGVETVVLGSCGEDIPPWPGNEPASLVRIPAAGTIEFVNEYARGEANLRSQRAVPAGNVVTPEQIDSDYLREANFIVVGPLLHDNISPELLEYLAEFAPLVLAAQGSVRYVEDGRIMWGRPERALRLMPFCEYVAMDEHELRFISGCEKLDNGAAGLMDSGAANLLITRGSEGSVLFLEGERYDISAFPPMPLVDPTGAGDSYLAGFIKALELDIPPRRRGEFAAMTATVSMEASGAFGGSVEEVLQRLGWS